MYFRSIVEVYGNSMFLAGGILLTGKIEYEVSCPK
ncbi:hypothetical protein IGK47_004147 [Enterococcus sp. AZ007]